MCNMWPANRKRATRVASEGKFEHTPFPILPRRDATKLPSTTRPRSADADMDVLDGLLASLDEEKNPAQEEDMPLSPKAKTKLDSKFCLESAVTPTRRSNKSKSERKCGIGIAPARSKHTVVHKGAGQIWNPVCYDDAVLVASPSGDSFSMDEPQSASVYCPLSPTIMSVHLPGSPIPQVSPMFEEHCELDDTAASVVLLGGPTQPVKSAVRPNRVRFEIRGSDAPAKNLFPQTPASDEGLKHAPRPPSRAGGRSRPLGCTMVANYGGA